MADEIVANTVFDRIRELYNLPSDAAMARYLGVFPQDVPRQRKSGNLPYKQILNVCPPADWGFIFTGRRPAEGGTIESALQTLTNAGYEVSIRKAPKQDRE